MPAERAERERDRERERERSAILRRIDAMDSAQTHANRSEVALDSAGVALGDNDWRAAATLASIGHAHAELARYHLQVARYDGQV
jgi:hypothetical protein